jgi:hypothetical protein
MCACQFSAGAGVLVLCPAWLPKEWMVSGGVRSRADGVRCVVFGRRDARYEIWVTKPRVAVQQEQ